MVGLKMYPILVLRILHVVLALLIIVLLLIPTEYCWLGGPQGDKTKKILSNQNFFWALNATELPRFYPKAPDNQVSKKPDSGSLRRKREQYPSPAIDNGTSLHSNGSTIQNFGENNTQIGELNVTLSDPESTTYTLRVSEKIRTTSQRTISDATTSRNTTEPSSPSLIKENTTDTRTISQKTCVPMSVKNRFFCSQRLPDFSVYDESVCLPDHSFLTFSLIAVLIHFICSATVIVAVLIRGRSTAILFINAAFRLLSGAMLVSGVILFTGSRILWAQGRWTFGGWMESPRFPAVWDVALVFLCAILLLSLVEMLLDLESWRAKKVSITSPHKEESLPSTSCLKKADKPGV